MKLGVCLSGLLGDSFEFENTTRNEGLGDENLEKGRRNYLWRISLTKDGEMSLVAQFQLMGDEIMIRRPEVKLGHEIYLSTFSCVEMATNSYLRRPFMFQGPQHNCRARVLSFWRK